MIGRPRGDEGQTIPLHLMAGVGLLFLALAFFAVGQAEDERNGTQTAADAAALAAAKDARDGLGPGLLRAIADGDLGAIGDLLGGKGVDGSSCSAASDYASRNGAHVEDCSVGHGPESFTVKVKSDDSVGESVVDGTEEQYATATATAVIESRCDLSDEPEPSPSEAEPSDSSPPDGEEPPPDDGEDDEDEPGPVTFDCDDGDVTVDPSDTGLGLDLGDFFKIRLTK